jgi:hypothetical protein
MDKKVDCRRTRPTAVRGGIVRKAADEVNENHAKDGTNRADSIRRPMTKVNSLPNNVEFPWISDDLNRISDVESGGVRQTPAQYVP